MSFRRLRPDLRAGLLVLVALGFASPGLAQSATRDSTDEQEGLCSSMECRWSAISAGVLVGTLSVTPANRAERVRAISVPRASSGNAQITPEECAPCKVNNRPFDVPPGILDKLFAELGVGSGVNSHSKKGGANTEGEGGIQVGDGNAGSNAEAGASGGSAGGPNGAGTSFGAGAVGGGPGVSAVVNTADITVTPEPQTLALVATGLIVLVPVSRRIRRRR